MKMVSKSSRAQNKICAFVSVSFGVRIVQRAVDFLWVLSEQFHDIDLATVGPAAVALVGRHHPNRRPDPLSLRQLRANVEAAILPVSLAARPNACGRVFASAARAGVRLFARFDREQTTRDPNV